jgi:hypothetical protein
MTVPPPHGALATSLAPLSVNSSDGSCFPAGHPRAVPTTGLWSLVVVHNHGNANAFGGLPFRIGGDALENV